MELLNNKLIQLPDCQILTNEEIRTILPNLSGNGLLIGTLTKGVFVYDGKIIKPWEVPVNEFLKKNQIFSARHIGDKYYAFGTIQDGLIITDLQGKVIQQINKKKG